MIRKISPGDLLLQRSSLPAGEDSKVIASTFSLQEQAPAIENMDGEFYELVSQMMKDKGVDRDEAMDSVRLQRLISVCDTKENTALYLLEEWNYEPQVYRFLKLLYDLGTKLDNVQDVIHNTPLHFAAAKDYATVAQFLIDRYPTMLLATNNKGDLPVETAIKQNLDGVAAFLVRKMDHRRVKTMFIGKQQRKASISFTKLTEEFKMQKTIVAVLDCLISPRWPHPPCLPSDVVTCLSWENLQDKPTHFHVTYDLLESDICGRLPDDPQFDGESKSCFYHLAKHCNQTLNKEILNHVVVKLLTDRKWKKYAAFWFRFRTANYTLFLVALCQAFLLALQSKDPSTYDHEYARMAAEVWCILMTSWFLIDETMDFRREPLAYVKDVFNYLDLTGYCLIFVTLATRVTGSNLQWTFASLAILINFLGTFKYFNSDRSIGLYIKCLGKVIYRDIPRFLFVFFLILLMFSVSYFVALRANHPNDIGSSLINPNTIRKDLSCTQNFGCIMVAGMLTWLEGSSVVSSVSTVGWLGALLIMLFMLSVSIIMLNILIAQLSLTYELVQEESLLSFTAVRMQSVSTIDWQSRFKFWNLKKKHYIPGEIRPRSEVEDLLNHHRNSEKDENLVTDQLKQMEQRLLAIETHLRQLRIQASNEINTTDASTASLSQKQPRLAVELS